jgi:hypothetical protein
VRRLFEWLTRPPAALRQAQAEIDYLRSEVHRLNDLLTQAWEASRVIPRQLEHTTPAAPETEQFKTLGQQQRDYEDECRRRREAFEQQESARLEQVNAPESKPN